MAFIQGSLFVTKCSIDQTQNTNRGSVVLLFSHYLLLLGPCGGLITFKSAIIDQEFGVTNNVDEKDMGDLQPDLFLRFGGHSGTEPKLREFHYLLHLLMSRAKAARKREIDPAEGTKQSNFHFTLVSTRFTFQGYSQEMPENGRGRRPPARFTFDANIVRNLP